MLRGTRIAVVLPSLAIGGAERQAFLLVQHLRHHGAEVAIFGMGDPGELAARCRELDIPCHALPRVESRWRWRAALRLSQAARRILVFRPHLLLPFTSAPNVLCGLIAADHGTPAIWNQRDEGLFPQHAAHEQRALSACAAWVANGPGSAAWLQRHGIASDRICILINAVRPDPPQRDRAAWRAALGIPPDAVVACMLATLSPAKDHATLLAAWAQVETALPNAWLILAGGDGGREAALRSQAQQLTRVCWAGRVADVSGLLSACDLGVLSSASEGLSNAVLDYRAAGLAIVASDVPGIRAAAGDGAVLVPPTQATALAMALISVLGDAQERATLASKSARDLPGTEPLDAWVKLIAGMLPLGAPHSCAARISRHDQERAMPLAAQECGAPRLTVLIPSKHRHAELARSLRTVLPMARRVGAEVIVCDQSPSPFAAPLGVRVLHHPELSGLPAARNVLLAATTADVVLFLDDDSDVAPDLGTWLLALAASEPEVAAWGAVVEVRSPLLRHAHRLLHLGCFRDTRRLTARRIDHDTSELFGCCFAVRRTAALSVHGFDARLPGYALGEDRDFCWRLRRAGFHLRFAAELRTHHRAVGGGNPALRPRLAYLRWWAARHGRGNPATLVHFVIVFAAWIVNFCLTRPRQHGNSIA